MRAAEAVESITSVVCPAPRDVWHSSARLDPASTATQSPAWMDAVVGQGRWRDASRSYTFTSGRVVVLPLVEWGRGPFRILRSWPRGWGVGGPIAAGGVSDAEAALVSKDLAAQGGISTRVLLSGSALAPVGTRLKASARTTQVLSLEGGFEKVRAERFDSGTRRYIRRAEQA